MLTVRRGQIEDLQRVKALLSQVWDDDYVSFTWEHWVQKPEEGIVLVAEHNGELVGTCYLKFMPNNTCWFQALRVHPGYRRLGVGSALTRGCLDEAKAAGRDAALLGIDADNTASLAMTERAGFEAIDSYLRLHKTFAQPPGSGDAGGWRKAVPEDAPAIISLIEQQGRKGIPPAIFSCWTWYGFCPDTVAAALEEEEIWVWENGTIQVCAGLERWDDEVNLFNPCGEDAVIVKAVHDLFGMVNKERNFDIWLHPNCQAKETLCNGMGFVNKEDDGYIIWRYPLQ